jgi:hypothetical protein
MPRRLHLVITGIALVFAVNASAFDFEFARASSSGGQFSVMLPKPFRELPPNTGGNPAAAIRPKQSYVIGGMPAPGVTFIATKIIYGSTSDARSVVTSLTTAEPPGFTREYMKRADAVGLAGLEIKSLSSSTVGYRRILLAGDAVFTLAAEAPAARDDEIKQAARKFLDSLMLAEPKKT